MSITDYEPKTLWKHFDKIRQIPRCSGHEENARNYVLEFARGKGWDSQTDAAGNVVVRVPGTSGHEGARTIAIQSHFDMVCEKNSDIEFDFAKDAIELQIDGEWLSAKGTTLGSDNGVGLAAGLAAGDDDNVVHGPLELLFTVDEERGLVGAGKLEVGFIAAKHLLNLDSEELDSVSIGCAGGGDSKITLPVTYASPPAGSEALRVEVKGLHGGHSGVDIHLQRGNAVKVLARILWEAARKHSISVATFSGGNLHNAIPREAHADVFIPSGDVAAFTDFSSNLVATVRAELGGTEDGMTLGVGSSASAPAQVLDAASQARLLNLLMAIPHGVLAMSYDIQDLVETSNNLASAATRENVVVISTSSRSSIDSALQSVRDAIRCAAELAGATVEEDAPYPGWKPNLQSDLLKVVCKVYTQLFGREPKAMAIHAGLECGIIGEQYPGMDMISFGPLIQYPHSPKERVNIPTVEQFWNLLKAILGELA